MTARITLSLLCGSAIFDAVGSGWEFLPAFKKHGVLDRYYEHTMWPRTKAGHYSDDTQHLLAMAEAILAMDSPYTIDDDTAKALFEKHLVAAYVRDIRGGSPRMEEAFVAAMEEGSDRLERFVTVKTAGSGAAMRASVFGLLEDVANILRLVGIQGSITHQGTAIVAAKIAALMTYCGRYGTHPQDLRVAIADMYPAAGVYLSDSYDGKAPRSGIQCVLAALCAVEKHESMSAILQHIMDMGGDTDTVAVIAFGHLLYSRYHFNDLPFHLFENLENGRFGRGYLRETDITLIEKLNGLYIPPEIMARRLTLRTGNTT